MAHTTSQKGAEAAQTQTQPQPRVAREGAPEPLKPTQPVRFSDFAMI